MFELTQAQWTVNLIILGIIAYPILGAVTAGVIDRYRYRKADKVNYRNNKDCFQYFGDPVPEAILCGIGWPIFWAICPLLILVPVITYVTKLPVSLTTRTFWICAGRTKPDNY